MFQLTNLRGEELCLEGRKLITTDKVTILLFTGEIPNNFITEELSASFGGTESWMNYIGRPDIEDCPGNGLKEDQGILRLHHD